MTGKPSEAQAPRALSQQYLAIRPPNMAAVSAIMREADTGYMWRLCDLLEHYRNLDCHLQTVASRRERALADVPWQMIAASDKRRDVRVAAWVEEVLRRIGDTKIRDVDPRSFTDAIVHLNAAVFHGYGAGEMAWGREGRYVRPTAFLPMAPRRFIFSQLDATLRWYDVTGPQTAWPGKDLLQDYPEGRFLSHRPRINGAVGTREGLARPLIWASVFRNWTISDWHKLAELAWKPYRIGTYNKADVVSPDRDILEEALELLTSTGFALIPDSVKISMEYAKNKGAGTDAMHKVLADFLAAEMSKVTLGSTLTVEQGKTGAMALGQVHESVTAQVRDADARSLEATIQRQLIAPLVRYNFGNVPIPQFRFMTEEGADLGFLADALKKLGDLKLAIPAKWVRATFGIPEPEIGEELLDGSVRVDPAELAAQKADMAAAAQAALLQKPAALVETDEEGPAVSEAAEKAAFRNYVVHNILTMAGFRRPANNNTVLRVA